MKQMETFNRTDALFFFSAMLWWPDQHIVELLTAWCLDVYDYYSSMIIHIKHETSENDVVLRQQDLGVNLLMQHNLSQTN